MFEKEKTNVVCMPCRTCICISVLHELIFAIFQTHWFLWSVHSFLNYFDSSDILILPTLFLMKILKIKENVISCDKDITKITWSTLNLYIFSDIKESSRGWAMNLGDEYQNFLIFIALLIAGVESWTTNFW